MLAVHKAASGAHLQFLLVLGRPVLPLPRRGPLPVVERRLLEQGGERLRRYRNLAVSHAQEVHARRQKDMS